VGAVIAVNCVGDVIDPATGKILAGAYDRERAAFIDTEEAMLADTAKRADLFSGKRDEAAPSGTECRSDAENTIIGAIITNARLTKAEANRLALVAHNGIARAVRPAHTTADGDTLFAIATGEIDADPDAVSILAVRAVERAIRNAVLRAEDLAGFPSAATVAESRTVKPAQEYPE
jgi:L-aminopeptidase/D-esterase-like protein